jgi:hypothetical protein
MGKDLEKSGQGLIKVLTLNFPRGTEESHDNSVTVAGILAEIRTKRLANTSPEIYYYAILLGVTPCTLVDRYPTI